MSMRCSPGRRLRTALPLLAALAVLGPLGWMWASSFVPSEYTATEMGYVDDGGVPVPGGHDHGDSSGGVPVGSSARSRARGRGRARSTASMNSVTPVAASPLSVRNSTRSRPK